MTSDQPVEARCDHCEQSRPLFLYQPDHGMHLGANVYLCRWCTRDKQPLLCVRCYSDEAELEDNDPALIEDARTLAAICAANRRNIERQTEDRETCEGIAEATEGDRP